MVQCWVQAVETFDYDWVLLHPDDYIELEPLAIKTVTGPRIPPSPVRELQASRETLKSLRIPDAQRDDRMPHHLAGLQGIKGAMDSSVAVGGRIAAPFSAVTLAYVPRHAPSTTPRCGLNFIKKAGLVPKDEYLYLCKEQ